MSWGCQCLSKPCKTSPVKNSNLHPMSPPHLHHGVRVVLDFVLCGKLVRSTNALYAISFRRCRILLSASFRFHLTMDTLAVQLMVPTTKPIADFHRLVTAHAGQTENGPFAGLPVIGPFFHSSVRIPLYTVFSLIHILLFSPRLLFKPRSWYFISLAAIVTKPSRFCGKIIVKSTICQ